MVLVVDICIALVVVTIFGLNFVAIKIALMASPPLLLTGLRFLLAAFPVLLILKPPRTSLRIVVAFGFVLGVVKFGLLFLGMALGMPAGLSSLVLQTQVFFTIGLAFLVFGERPSGLQLLSALIAGCGVGVIAAWQGQHALLGAFLLVIGAALFWGVANVIVKAAGRIDMLALMVWGSLVAAPPLLALSLVIEGPDAITTAFLRADAQTWGAVLFIAYPTTILAFALWNRLLSRYPAVTVTPFALLIPIIGLSSSRWLLAEPFEAAAAAGAALIFFGIALDVLVAWFRQRRAGGPRSTTAITAVLRDRPAP
ncbi:EamA family transporter [Methylobacterium sp. J-072]|uniref:EamA family transporter n=1 Tax=Methylobacterium sp. J-072 TaxID=2836651 RepID=UPI001FB88C2E|nr:EamA family transporter [Methylobacterium sp. J-072]MCJ2096829.1 EamA family transporter [Methylobacterium sp. J-072]